MNNKFKQHALLCSLVFFFLIGILELGIGETFCRYVLSYDTGLLFEVKGIGEYYVLSDNQWNYDVDNNLYTLDFDVTNKNGDNVPSDDHTFNLRWSTTTTSKVDLIHIQNNGKENRYHGVLIGSNNIYAYYCFYNHDGYEASFTLEGNRESKEKFKIEVIEADDSYLGTIEIVDAPYQESTSKKNTYQEVEALQVSSNLLSEKNVTYIYDDDVELSMLVNRDLKSKLTVSTNNGLLKATLSGNDINLVANSESKVILKVEEIVADEGENIIEENNETTSKELDNKTVDGVVSVVWTIYDNNDKIIKELKADFKFEQNKTYSTIPVINIESAKDVYDKNEVIKLDITSDIETKLLLKSSLIKPKTMYSFDGVEWLYITNDQLNINCHEGQNSLWLDLSKTNNDGLGQTTIDVIFNNDKIGTTNINVLVPNYDILMINEINSGIINNKEVSFKANINDFDLNIEQKLNQEYRKVDLNSYFELEVTESVYTLKLKENSLIQEGNYRIIIDQKNEDEIVKRYIIPFFVINNERGS